MAPKPEKVGWINDDTSNIVTPSASRFTSGWLLGVKPPAENFNWFWNLVSRIRDWMAGEAQFNIIIDTDTDEGDYTTLAAYIADAPAAGDRVLIKNNQVLTASTVIPAGITIKILKGVVFSLTTNFSPIIVISDNITIKGDLILENSDTGTIATAINFNGNNSNIDNISVENKSTGTITNAAQIAAAKNGIKAHMIVANTGGGAITNVFVDGSGVSTNYVFIRDIVNNKLSGNVINYIDNKVLGLLDYKGGYDAATNTPDLDTAPAGVLKGDTYSVTAAGVFFTVNVEIGDFLIAEIDNASVEADWTVLNKNIDAASIKTLYESNADTNAFTDAEKSKLAGIESGAEVNNISDIDATDLTDSGETTLHSHPGSTPANDSVGQAQLKKNQGEVNTASTTPQTLTLPGGEYGFYPRVRYAPGTGSATATIGANGFAHSSYLTVIQLNVTVDGTAYAQQRYITASPPYKLGNKEWGHFLFVLRRISDDFIIASYEAQDPPWAYNGPSHNPKDSKERIQAVPHPFVNYFDKDPAIDGLEIQLIDLNDFDMQQWEENNPGKQKLENMDEFVINKKGAIRPMASFGLNNIPGFTNIVIIRSRK